MAVGKAAVGLEVCAWSEEHRDLGPSICHAGFRLQHGLSQLFSHRLCQQDQEGTIGGGCAPSAVFELLCS